MPVPSLSKIERLDLNPNGVDLYLVASSFEPRSVRATTMLDPGSVQHAIVFQYEDTLDTALGQENARQIRVHLEEIGTASVAVLPCRFSDPYSATRTFHMFVAEKALAEKVRTVFMDTTCFTKLHMLMLLRYLDTGLSVRSIRVSYTEPLVYATAFGKALSYGIQNVVYLPYTPAPFRSQRAGLIAFLGHERLRLESIIQELEPDVSVILLGEPGFTRDMLDDSRRINDGLIHRSTYDRQYRLESVSTNDISDAMNCLEKEVERMKRARCDSVYLAPLGTKLQALGIDMLRRSGVSVRMLLAYSIPKRYERKLYSQGSGPTYSGVLLDETV